VVFPAQAPQQFTMNSTKIPKPINECISKREREIIRLIAEGKNNREIAASLRISIKTVETHRANVMRKLEIDNAPKLVRYAIRNNIIRA
jgi:DNA-binding NarL/FixJ family response regulator